MWYSYRKHVSILVVFFVLAGVLAGCVAPGAAPAGGEGAAASGQKVKVVYWGHNFEPRVELDKKYIEQFMKDNPDIEVEYTASEVIKGREPQLERAVQEALRLLEQSPNRRVPRPSPIDRVTKGRDK